MEKFMFTLDNVLEELRENTDTVLTVNYDGETEGTIQEVEIRDYDDVVLLIDHGDYHNNPTEVSVVVKLITDEIEKIDSYDNIRNVFILKNGELYVIVAMNRIIFDEFDELEIDARKILKEF